MSHYGPLGACEGTRFTLQNEAVIDRKSTGGIDARRQAALPLDPLRAELGGEFRLSAAGESALRRRIRRRRRSAWLLLLRRRGDRPRRRDRRAGGGGDRGPG